MEQLWEAAAARRQGYQRLPVAGDAGVCCMARGCGAVNWSRLDVSDWIVRQGTLLIDGRKTGRERQVAVPELTWRCLEAYLPQRQNQLERTGPCCSEPALFVNQDGGRLSAAVASAGDQDHRPACGARADHAAPVPAHLCLGPAGGRRAPAGGPAAAGPPDHHDDRAVPARGRPAAARGGEASSDQPDAWTCRRCEHMSQAPASQHGSR